MKKTFITFPTGTGTLPKISNRRMGFKAGRESGARAYKSDGDDPDALEAKLTALKSALEGSITTKQKAAIDTAIAGVQAKLDEKEALRVAMQTAIDEAKATIKVLKDAADLNQPIIDKFVAGKGQDMKPADQTFNAQLEKGLTEKAAEIKAFRKGASKISIQMEGEGKALGDMLFANSFPTADVSITTLRPGIIELPKRKLHIRQLLSGGSMDSSNFAYVKETAGEGAIAPVAEGVLKPQIDLNLQEVSVPAQYIAGWLRISRKMLDDVRGMTTFLQSRLPELLLRAEDNQLLNGDGTGSNLSGITDAGNFTAPTGTATIDVEQLVQAVAQLEGYDREANGILLNPADYYQILLNKAAGGAGTYDLPSALATIQNGQLYIAGIPVFRSTAMAADKFIVGDWVMGANLITREAPRVEIFYEDGINVRENMVTVRVEERIAFPIYGDNYFIYGDFGNLT